MSLETQASKIQRQTEELAALSSKRSAVQAEVTKLRKEYERDWFKAFHAACEAARLSWCSYCGAVRDEGNGYSPAAGADADNSVYEADADWSGHVYFRELTPTLRDYGYDEEDLGSESAVPCLVIWPVN